MIKPQNTGIHITNRDYTFVQRQYGEYLSLFKHQGVHMDILTKRSWNAPYTEVPYRFSNGDDPRGIPFLIRLDTNQKMQPAILYFTKEQEAPFHAIDRQIDLCFVWFFATPQERGRMPRHMYEIVYRKPADFPFEEDETSSFTIAGRCAYEALERFAFYMQAKGSNYADAHISLAPGETPMKASS